MKKKNNPKWVWDVFYPVILYLVLMVLVMNVIRSIIGVEASKYMPCQIISTVIILPIIFFGIYKRPGIVVTAPIVVFKKPTIVQVKRVLIIMIITLILSLGLNNIILMSPLPTISGGYKQASTDFYGSILIIEIIGSGILTPILEELVYRGIVYGRLRFVFGIIPSLVISSLIFATIHTNIVQFIYALIMGLALSIFMEWSQGVYGAICGHIVANVFAVLRTELGLLNFTVERSTVAWGISSACLLIGISAVYILYRQSNKENKESLSDSLRADARKL